MGRLQQRPAPLTPCAKKIKAFADYMEHEAELSPATIYSRCWCVRRFLRSAACQRGFSARDHSSSDRHGVSEDARTGRLFADDDSNLRRPHCGLSSVLRKHGAGAVKDWRRPFGAPRVFSQASLPLGPSWDDVRRLLAMTEGDQPHNIRARPMLMLFAIYGLRAGEVSRLRLEDFDWEHEVFRVVSSKTGRVRTYPLMRSVGDAILRYLQEVRPRSSHRELFLITAPSLPAGAHAAVEYGRRSLAIPTRVASTLRASCPTSCLRGAIAGRRPVSQGDRRPTGAHGPRQHADLCQGRSRRPPSSGRFRPGRCPMNLQRLIEQYISFQQSLGSSFTTECRHSPGFRPCPWPASQRCQCSRSSMWMRSWAKPGQ